MMRAWWLVVLANSTPTRLVRASNTTYLLYIVFALHEKAQLCWRKLRWFLGTSQSIQELAYPSSRDSSRMCSYSQPIAIGQETHNHMEVEHVEQAYRTFPPFPRNNHQCPVAEEGKGDIQAHCNHKSFIPFATTTPSFNVFVGFVGAFRFHPTGRRRKMGQA